MADGTAAASQPDLYFANKVGQDFVSGGRQAEKNWLYAAQDSGLWRLWWLLYSQTLGMDADTGEQNVNQQLRAVGEEARYIAFRVQLTRMLIQQKTMLAKDERPSFEGVASNNNAASLAKVNMASKAIEYVLTESKLEQKSSGALEANGYFGAGGIHQSWNYGGGRMVDAQEPMTNPDGSPAMMPETDGDGNPIPETDPETGEMFDDGTGQPKMREKPVMQTVKKRSGALKFDKLYPWQQATDPFQEDDHSWVIIKTPVNKYELAAKYPEKAKEIIALSIDAEMGDDALFAWGDRTRVSSDILVLRTFYHRNCDAVEGGRMAQWCGSLGLYGCDEIMPCPLDEGLPWEPIIAGRYFCTAFGYPEASDLLSVQSALNETMSQTLTLIQKHGNPNLYKREDVEIDPDAYQAGGAMFDLPPGAEAPTVTKYDDMGTAPAFMIQFCREIMPLMIGLNPTVQGTPETNITSGAFGVLLVNLAQKFASQLQEAYDFALVNTANKSIELIKKNASNGFWAEVSGIADEPYLKLFTHDTLDDFHSVKIVRRNPVMSTFMGRVQILELTRDMAKPDRADAMELLLDSRTDAYAENDQSATIRMRKENEMMLKAPPRPAGLDPAVDPMAYNQWLASWLPKVSWSDPHHLEVPKHVAERDKLRSQDPPQDMIEFTTWTDTINGLDYHAVDHANTWASTALPMLLVAGIPPLNTGAPAPGADPGGNGDKPGKPGEQSPSGAPNAMLPAAASGSMSDTPGAPDAPSGPNKPAPPAGAEGAGAGNG